MQLTITPEELVPIVRNHLETTMGLTLSGMVFTSMPDMPSILRGGTFGESGLVLQIEVQPSAAQRKPPAPEPVARWVTWDSPPRDGIHVFWMNAESPAKEMGLTSSTEIKGTHWLEILSVPQPHPQNN